LTREAARARLGWALTGRYLLTVARLTPWKGIDMLIDALAHTPDVTLIVAGDGPQKAALEARAVERGVGGRVVFAGKVPHDHIAVFMRAADYLVLYSGYEGLSHTLLEALYVGTPVIASARGGNPEIVQDSVNGLLVKHPDTDALIAALQRALADGVQTRLAGGTGHGLARFRWDVLVEQTTRVLTHPSPP
jgi:glycosyltransferase involved in cell wall biosynthesis